MKKITILSMTASIFSFTYLQAAEGHSNDLPEFLHFLEWFVILKFLSLVAFFVYKFWLVGLQWRYGERDFQKWRLVSWHYLDIFKQG